ncbi:MAG TPA: calcium-binding protein [Acidiphilium sp.]
MSIATSVVSVQASANDTVSFSVDSVLTGAIQAQLNNITTEVENPNSQAGVVTASFVTLNGAGSPTGSLPTVPDGTSTYEYVYLSGTVTGSGGQITLPGQTVLGPNRNIGFAGLIATFAGNETVTGGAGQNELVITGAKTNLTWDPQGGSQGDSIYAGGGNNNFTLDGTNYYVLAGSGSNTITAAQNLNPQTSAYGNNEISTSGGNNLIDLDAGTNSVVSSGNDTVNVASASTYNLITVNGGGPVSVAAGSKDNQISIGGASVVIDQGMGDTITASGAATIFAVGAGDQVSAGSSATVYDAMVQTGSGVVGFSVAGAVQTQTQELLDNLINNTTPPGVVQLISVTGSSTTLQSAGDNVVVDNAAGTSTVVGNNASTTLFVAAAGSNVTYSLQGGNSPATMIGGGGNDDFTLGNNSSLSGSQVYFGGGGDRVRVHTGSNTVTATGNASVFSGITTGYSGSLDFINQSSAAATVIGGAGSATVFGGAGGGIFFGGTLGNNSLVGGTGNTTLVGGGDNDTLQATGSGSSNTLFANTGNEIMIAGTGTGANVLVAGAGTDSLVSGGSGVQNFFGGSGSATMTGSAVTGAQNSYFFGQVTGSGGNDVITNFSTTNSALYVNHDMVITSIGEATVGKQTGALVTLTDGTHITLLGVTSSGIQQYIGKNYIA